MVKNKTPILIFLLICFTGFAAFAVGRSMMSVQVKTGELRLAPSFLGEIVARLYYGKGFNQQVESEFRAKNPNLDFTWVDKMETYVVSEEEMKQFLEKGGLSPEGGF